MKRIDKKKIAERLNKIINEKFDKTALHYAKASGVKSTSLQKYIDAQSVPGGENLVRLAVAGEVSCDWILTGYGSQKKRWPVEEAD